jgi:hypothetical protein
MTAIYGNFAAPLATSASTLGVATQPTTTGTTATGGGNAAISTGFSSTPATTTVGGGNTLTLPRATQNAAASLGTSVANVQAAQSTAAAAVGSTLANDLVTATGGGAISDALKNGVSKIVAFAQTGMANIQKAIQADMAANNGEIDPAKMQLYTMRMSTYELLNQMAAKIQEKEDSAIQRWLR